MVGTVWCVMLIRGGQLVIVGNIDCCCRLLIPE